MIRAPSVGGKAGSALNAFRGPCTGGWAGSHHVPRTGAAYAMETPMKNVRWLAASMAAVLLAGCASNRISDDEKLALYQASAGAPVSSFNFFGAINGWTSLGDQAVAVWTKPSEAYLLELYGPCHDLPFSQVISVTSQMNRVSAGFDKVMARSAGSIDMPCRIKQIRPLDVKTIRQAEKTLRAQSEAAGT